LVFVLLWSDGRMKASPRIGYRLGRPPCRGREPCHRGPQPCKSRAEGVSPWTGPSGPLMAGSPLCAEFDVIDGTQPLANDTRRHQKMTTPAPS